MNKEIVKAYDDLEQVVRQRLTKGTDRVEGSTWGDFCSRLIQAIPDHDTETREYVNRRWGELKSEYTMAIWHSEFTSAVIDEQAYKEQTLEWQRQMQQAAMNMAQAQAGTRALTMSVGGSAGGGGGASGLMSSIYQPIMALTGTSTASPIAPSSLSGQIKSIP